MIRRLYQQTSSPRRLLSIEEIASACNLSPQRVRKLLGNELLSAATGKEQYLDAMEVSLFMLRQQLPVPSRLLPPSTKKVLVISAKKESLKELERWGELICKAFHGRFNILLETAYSEDRPELNIMAHRPDLVAILPVTCPRMTNIFKVLENDPAIKTLLVVSEAMQAQADQRQIRLQGDRIIADHLSAKQVVSQIASIFDC